MQVHLMPILKKLDYDDFFSEKIRDNELNDWFLENGVPYPEDEEREFPDFIKRFNE